MKVWQPPVGTPINRSHPLSAGLIGFWPLNEGGGQKAFDYAFNNNGGLANGAVYTKNVKGSCVSFDGVDDIVSNVGNLATYICILNMQFTISAWIQLANNTTRYFFIGTDTSSANISFYFKYEIVGGGFGAKALGIGLNNGNSGNPQGIFESADNVITDTNWHHVAVTCNGNTTSSVNFYVDGVLFPGIFNQGNLLVTATAFTNKLSLGSCNGAIPLAGKMNNVMIYNRPLLGNEIRRLFTNPYQMFV